MISGFLFFKESQAWLKIEDYLKKWKSRCRSLLVPYLLWNLIAYIVYAVQNGFSLSDFIHAFWIIDIPGRSGSSPIDGPLWYIRNLLLMVMISPFISVMLKYTKWFLLVMMAVLWIFQVSIFAKGIGIAFFFFSLGGYLRMNGISVEKLRIGAVILIGYIVWLLLHVFYGDSEFVAMEKLRLLMGIYSAIYLASFVAQRDNGISKETSAFLAESSFFVYCCHDILLPFLKEILYCGTTTSALDYLVVIVVDTLLCLALFLFFSKCLPSVGKILTGGR